MTSVVLFTHPPLLLGDVGSGYGAWHFLEKEERERLGTFPLSIQTARGLGAVGSVGDVCGNDHEFGLAIVLGKLNLGLAHPELTASGIAVRPNLIQEVVVAQALEYQLGSG
jgi:hypothetical protein